jgi:hypothetical protein
MAPSATAQTLRDRRRGAVQVPEAETQTSTAHRARRSGRDCERRCSTWLRPGTSSTRGTKMRVATDDLPRIRSSRRPRERARALVHVRIVDHDDRRSTPTSATRVPTAARRATTATRDATLARGLAHHDRRPRRRGRAARAHHRRRAAHPPPRARDRAHDRRARRRGSRAHDERLAAHAPRRAAPRRRALTHQRLDRQPRRGSLRSDHARREARAGARGHRRCDRSWVRADQAQRRRAARRERRRARARCCAGPGSDTSCLASSR